MDVFRRPEAVPAIVDEVLALGIPALWLQETVVHEEAAEKAREAGVLVVMDKCILKEHRRYGLVERSRGGVWRRPREKMLGRSETPARSVFREDEDEIRALWEAESDHSGSGHIEGRQG